MSIFEDSNRRFDRALIHAKAFKAIWESLVKPESFSTEIKLNANRTTGVVRAIHPDFPENDLAIEIGEMFYQLRAALDCAVYKAAVLAESIDPPSNEDRVEFPIYSSSKRFQGNPVNDSPFPSKLRDWLELIQPYNADKTENTELANLWRFLEILHDCARKDRHRKLHLIAAVPSSVQYSIDPPGLVKAVRIIGDANFLEGKDEFLAFDLVQSIPGGYQGKFQLNTDIMVEISIENVIRPIMPGQSGYVFARILESVRFVLDYFESFFS
jgi:hypothetical protein